MSTSRKTDFDWRCVIGAVDTDMADLLSETQLGLPMSQTFIYGTVRDADGTIWTPMRRLAAGDGGDEKLLLQTDLESDAIHIHRAGRASALSRGVRRGRDGDGVMFESDPLAEGAPFQVRAVLATKDPQRIEVVSKWLSTMRPARMRRRSPVGGRP